jgi:hypothetical protein
MKSPFNLRIKYFIVLQIFCSFHLVANIDKKPRPAWTEAINYNYSKAPNTKSGFEYLLMDLQINVELQQAYSHYAIQLSNAQAVQDFSTIEIDYDPTFQSVWIHEIKVFRNNKYINKYIPGSFLALASTDRDVHIFDGSITATSHLEDILPGDILEYSYTIIGFQPAMAGKYERSFSLQYGIPLDKLNIKLLYSSKRKLDFKIFNEIPQVKQIKSSSGSYQTIKWHGVQIPSLITDQNIPSWFNPFARVEVSEWQNWAEVVNWGIGLYKLSANELEASRQQQENLTKGLDSLEAIVKLIKFVQNEIRYLGLEQGKFSFIPRPPSTVMATKRGDCKEKSLLLIALLRNFGVEAYPILVNTSIGKILDITLPGPFNFDHCIVGVNFNGKQYFVDPVISDQTIPLTLQPVSRYYFGLPLKTGTKSLMLMPKPVLTSRKVFDTYTFSEKENDAKFEVYSVYQGYDADLNRKYYFDNSQEANSKNYLSYYSTKYPGIFEASPHKDDKIENDTINEYAIFEYYGISDFWQKEAETGQLFNSFEPMQISYLADISDKSKRTMPWDLGDPLELNYNILLQSDLGLTSEDQILEVSNDFFHYRSEVMYTSATIKLEYYLKFTADHVPAEKFAEFVEDMGKVINDLNYTITLGSTELAEESSFNFGVFFITICCLLLALFLIRRLFKYDPEPILKDHSSWAIGSWLFIFPVGLLLTIFWQLTEIFQTYLPYISNNELSGTLGAIAPANQITYFLLIFFEIFINFFLVSMSILLLVLFFRRRSSFPLLFSVFQVAKLLAVIIIQLLFSSIKLIDGTNISEAEPNEIWAFVFPLIWIPIVLNSQRSKNTFVLRLKTGEVIQDEEIGTNLSEPENKTPDLT